MENKINTLKKEFSDNHKLRLAEAEFQGRLIGNEDLPQVDEEHQHPYEDILLKKYEGDINKLDQEYSEDREALFSEYRRLQLEIEIIAKDEKLYVENIVKSIEENLKLEIEKENQSSQSSLKGINDQDKLIQYEKNKAEENLLALQLKYNRKFLNISFKSSKWYIAILLILGIAEAPLNFAIFEQFREDNISTVLMAGTLIIGIPFGAHFCGLYIKRRKDRKIHTYISIAIFLTILALSFYVGLQRADFMSKFPSFDNSITLPTFVTLSIFLFLVGSSLSYAHYDDSSEFQIAWSNFSAKAKIYDEKMPKIIAQRNIEKDRLNRAVERLRKETNDQIKEARSVRIRYDEEFAQVKAKYDSTIKTLEAESKSIIANCSEAISTFRRYNLSARQSQKMPKSFEKDPKTPENPFTKYDELDPNDIS